MKKKLVTVNSKEIINDLREIDNVTLLYPLKSFCVGYLVEFEIEEIDDFVLVNRILDDEDLDLLKKVLNKGNIKGIVFDDLGVLDIIKNLNIVKILLLDHLATNYESINYYLEYVDSVVVSNDLTEEEIKEILNKSKKGLVLNVFGLKTLMYSRRLLLTNYNKFHNLEFKNNEVASIENKKFRIIENEYGTKFYALKYYNALKLLELENVFFYWYDTTLLNKEDTLKLIKENNVENIECDELFLNKATIYKVGDIDA